MLFKISAAPMAFVAVFLTASQSAFAQTIDGDILRGQGKFAEGAGWYNVNTARANAINVSAMRNYNEEVRLNYRNRVMFWAEKREGKKLSTEEAQKRADARLEELRNNPSNDDIRSGEAINILVGFLSDSGINPQDWQDKTVKLPAGATIKDIVFHHYPKKMAPNEMKVTVALSRLGKDVEWPIFLNNAAFDSERAAYVNAVSMVKRTVLSNKFEPNQIKALNNSLDKLKEKIESSLDAKGGYRSQGKEFHTELANATKLFEASNIDWAKYILQETDQYDATTVEQLIAFMRQYRLLFAAADSPRSTKLYNDLFVSMKKQSSVLSVEPGRMEAVRIDPAPKPIDRFAVGAVWHGTGFYTNEDGTRGGPKTEEWELRIAERTGDKFRGSLDIHVNSLVVSGTAPVLSSGPVSFKAINGPQQHNYDGELHTTGKISVSFSGRGSRNFPVWGKVEMLKLDTSKSEPVVGDTRGNWKHSKGAFRFMGKNWDETDASGKVIFRFSEIARTKDFVELDRPELRVRLYSNRCEIANKPKLAYLERYRGAWQKADTTPVKTPSP